jgi:hypothetical protein
MHGVVVDPRAIRMGTIANAKMIAANAADVAVHCDAAEMIASAEAAHARTAV